MRGALLAVAGLLAGCAAPGPPLAEGPGPLAAPVLVGLGTPRVNLVGAGDTLLACSDFPGLEPGHDIGLWVSRDAAGTWQPVDRGHASSTPGGCSLAITAGGAWGVAISGPSYGAGVLPGLFGPVDVGVSEDEGRTWVFAEVHFPTSPGGGGLAAVGEDLLLFGGGHPRCMAANLHVSRSSDHGRSWSTPTPVYTYASPAFDPRFGLRWPGNLVALAGGQTLLLPFMGFDSMFWRQGCGVPPPVGVPWDGGPVEAQFGLASSQDGGATWTDRILVQGLRANLPGPSLALSDGGTVAYVFNSADGDVSTIRVMASEDGGATWTEPAEAHRGGTARHHKVPAIGGPGGTVDIAWEQEAEGAEAFAVHLKRVEAATGEVREARALTGPVLDGRNLFLQLDRLDDGRRFAGFASRAPPCAPPGEVEDCVYVVAVPP